MKVSGFTIARNCVRYNYPFIESIQSALPICDEFIINVGDSDDETLDRIRSIKDPKIRIIQNKWDASMGKEVLSHQTNLALKECKGDWAFYLQLDEVIHEDDYARLQVCMRKYADDLKVDVLRFRWFHFYGSYFRYRIDKGWYQKQDRVIRNNREVESCGDAFCFHRKDGKPLRAVNTGAFIYHYGWVQPTDVMASRRKNAESIGFVKLKEQERVNDFFYGDLNRFVPYFGSHPKVMNALVNVHEVSVKDKARIKQKFWWHPANMLGLRFKTGKRVKHKIE